MRRIRNVVAMPAFADYTIRANDLRELAEVVLGIYASFRDFTALHMLTACHATRLVWPYVEDREEALAYLGTALLAAYVTIGRPAPSSEPAHTSMDWDEISRRAVASDDDHVAKLVFSAREEHRAYGDPRYQEVAAWKVG